VKASISQGLLDSLRSVLTYNKLD